MRVWSGNGVKLRDERRKASAKPRMMTECRNIGFDRRRRQNGSNGPPPFSSFSFYSHVNHARLCLYLYQRSHWLGLSWSTMTNLTYLIADGSPHITGVRGVRLTLERHFLFSHHGDISEPFGSGAC